MHIRKVLFALLGLATAFALAPMSSQAGAPLGPNAVLGADSLVETVQAKKKASTKKAKAKKGKSASRAGRCGTGKYWSRSKRSCQDAALGPAKK